MRIRAFLRLLRIREAKARRQIEIAGRGGVVRASRWPDRKSGDFSNAWLAQARGQR